MNNKEILFDYDKALQDKEESKGIYTMNKLFISLQIAHIRKETEIIKSLKNVFDAYHNNPDKNKIKLIYIDPKNNYWNFIVDNDDNNDDNNDDYSDSDDEN